MLEYLLYAILLCMIGVFFSVLIADFFYQIKMRLEDVWRWKYSEKKD